MDKLKQTFSRSKEAEAEDTTTAGATGKVTGQGSHFSSTKAMDRDTLGATAAAQQDAGVGAPTTDPRAAQATGGPEVGGGEHVGTVNPSQLSQGGSDPPAGQTTTYSTHHLTKGDPTPSVIDPESSDPTTFKKPEATAPATGSAGVPPNAAQVAASKAFSGSAHGEGMPGAYPDTDYENPYRAENLDPRVDSLPIRSKDNTHSGIAAAAAGTAVGAGAASTSTGRDTGRDTSRTAAEPSVLPSTVDSADKSADYSRPQQTQPATSGAVSQEDQDKQSSGFVGKALAAVGLGGAAGAAGYGLANRDGKESAVGDTTLPADSTPKPTHGRKESIPTTAYPAGVDSPRAINPPVGGTTSGTEAPSAARDSHTGRDTAIGAAGLGAAGAAGYGASQYAGRKDNEPSRTTPATATTIGQDNTSKLREDLTNQPSGISSEARSRAAPADEESHTGRNVALGAAGLGAAGAAGYGASQYAGRKDNEPSRAAPATATTLGQDNTSQLREDLASQPAGISPATKEHAAPASTTQTTSATAPSTQREPEDHTKRNAALAAGGVGAGAGAAGAYAATRDNKQEPFGHTAIYGPDTTGTSAHQATTSNQPTAATTSTNQPASGYDQSRPKEEEDHTGRNAALAGAAGAGVVGAGAYAANEESKKRAEEEAAKRAAAAEKERKAAEKARAEQQKAHEKELEKQEKKQQKEAEKSAKKEEKEHQKEVAAMEKQRTKEEKEHQKEAAAMEKQRTKEEEERRRQEEEEEERKKKAAAAAAVGGAGAAGAGAYAYDKSKDDESPKSPATKSEEKEKKPGLFKRIFKRRKNKDTGESEEYSSDEEEKDDSHKGAAVAGAAAGTGALGAGAAYGAHEREERKLDTTDPASRDNIGTAHSTDEPQSRYEAVSGGAQKPSYNPLAKDDPSKEQTLDERTGHQAEPYRYDDQRATAAGTTGSSTGEFPVEPTTGLPYDPSKDLAAAQRISEHEANTPADASRASVDSGEPGSPSEKKGLRQKLKEAITGHKEEEQGQHGDHSVLHKKSHQIPEDVKTSSEGP